MIFIAIIFLVNFTSAIIASSVTESDFRSELSSSLTGVLSTAKEVYEKGELKPNDIEKLYASEFITVKFYDSFNKLTQEYDLSEEKLRTTENRPVILQGKSKGKLYLSMPISIVKSREMYIVSALKENNIFSNLRIIFSSFQLLSIFFGTIIMLIAGWFIVKPIKKLSVATEKIAKGDFDVYIDEKRKDEIGQLIGNFNKMAKELAGMEMLRNNFISDISHEFKTPLTSIEGYTKLLKYCKNDEECNEYINIITEETKRLSALSGNILLLNRIENENITLVKNSFRLDEQIRQVILLNENKWISKNIDLNINLEEIIYIGNEQLLFQVWLNLFDNAIKFSSPNEAIELSLKKSEDRIIFSIMDYGKGMTEEEKSRMFEKFYTGDKSRNTEGNGLGLSIVKRIVDMHGGIIEVESRLDEFTVIKVIL